MPTDFPALLSKIEAAIDAHPELVRLRRNGDFMETAELVVGRFGWTARIRARNKIAKGRGSQGLTTLHGDGETPEIAVESLIERLPFWTEALK